MELLSTRRGRVSFVLASTLLLAAAGAITTVSASSTNAAITALGPEWDCWQLAWMTSCTHTRAAGMTPHKHNEGVLQPEA
jgi:hypothetical protein